METIAVPDLSGSLERYANFPSINIQPRHVDVWIPPGYYDHGDTRYAVVYMHDGQNLFNPASSYAGVDWGIDEAVAGLVGEGQIPAPIVVGIWNSSARVPEYMPQKPLERPDARRIRARFAKEGVLPFSDAYLKFLVEELKPWMDANYPTLPDPAHTAIMGSSMGGLISLYAAVEYPHVFGRAGCVSTHWPIGGMPLIDWLKNALPRPGSQRFYFDYGTKTLDARYGPYQKRVDAVMQAAGYQPGKDWLTMKFQGDAHSERSWRKRVHIPLKFLLSQAVD